MDSNAKIGLGIVAIACGVVSPFAAFAGSTLLATGMLERRQENLSEKKEQEEAKTQKMNTTEFNYPLLSYQTNPLSGSAYFPATDSIARRDADLCSKFLTDLSKRNAETERMRGFMDLASETFAKTESKKVMVKRYDNRGFFFGGMRLAEVYTAERD